MKKIVIFVLLIAVALTGSWYYWSANEAAGEQNPYRKQTVERGDIQSSVAASGSVEALREVEIMSKASGEISELPVDVSDHVEPGDLLARLNPIDEQRRMRQSRIQLETAEAAYEDARAREQRQKDLYDEGVVSYEEYQSARLDKIRARADLENQEIELELARQRLDDTEISATFEGLVAERLVQEGEIITSGLGEAGDGTPILLIADLSKMYVNAAVDESDIGEIRPGQKAVVTVDAYPLREFSGEVERIAVKGVVEGGVVTYDVKVNITDEDASEYLKPEMTADVEIITDQRRDVALVNAAALHGQPGNYQLLISVEPEQDLLPVEVGLHDGEKAEITDGIEIGDNYYLPAEGDAGEWSRPEGRGLF